LFRKNEDPCLELYKPNLTCGVLAQTVPQILGVDGFYTRLANVRFWLGTVLTNNVRFTLDSRHSNRHVGYRADLVRFTPESRRGSGRSRESEVDPKPTLDQLKE
jgi:hypothetical protein